MVFLSADWIENFRISHETSNYLCQQLRPVIEKQNTRLHCLLSVEKHCDSIVLNIDLVPAYMIVHEMCKAIVEVLLKLYIIFPEGERIS